MTKLAVKKILNNIFSLLGVTVSRKKNLQPVDLRLISNNPKSLLYYTNVTKQILIEAPLINGRGLEYFSLSNESYHPFIRAIKHSLENGENLESIKDYLSRYYQLVQPLNASEWLVLGDNKSELSNHPAWVTVLPWENVSIQQKILGRAECANHDSIEHGDKIPISQGWRHFGPVSENLLMLEARRLHSIMKSVKTKGLLRHNNEGGDVGAIVLMKSNREWRWMVEWGGQHRAAAISALGYKTLPIRVWQVVCMEDVELWPNVQSGLYNVDSALAVFDNIYNAVPPKVVDAWRQYAEA